MQIRAASFANRKSCSFIRRKDAFQENFVQAAKKPATRAEFSLIRALIPNWHLKLWKAFLFIYFIIIIIIILFICFCGGGGGGEGGRG